MAHEGSYKASLSLERPNLAWQKVSKIWFIKQFFGRDEEEEYKFLGKLFFEVSASVPSLILQHFVGKTAKFVLAFEVLKVQHTFHVNKSENRKVFRKNTYSEIEWL